MMKWGNTFIGRRKWRKGDDCKERKSLIWVNSQIVASSGEGQLLLNVAEKKDPPWSPGLAASDDLHLRSRGSRAREGCVDTPSNSLWTHSGTTTFSCLEISWNPAKKELYLPVKPATVVCKAKRKLCDAKHRHAHTSTCMCTHTHLLGRTRISQRSWLVLKDLKKTLCKETRKRCRKRSGRDRGVLGSEPGGPSVTGWRRGVTGAHIS